MWLNLTTGPSEYTLARDAIFIIYTPVKVPEGYPDNYVVLKDNNVIGKETLSYEYDRINIVGDHCYGEYAEVCKAHPLWRSHLMFNPAKTPVQLYAEAEKSGVIARWKSGEEIESSEDGKEWEVNSTPNFSLPLRWRMKTRPIVAPKFDWRLISDNPRGRCLCLLADGNIVMGCYHISHGYYEDWLYGNTIFPTHYTILE